MLERNVSETIMNNDKQSSLQTHILMLGNMLRNDENSSSSSSISSSSSNDDEYDLLQSAIEAHHVKGNASIYKDGNLNESERLCRVLTPTNVKLAKRKDVNYWALKQSGDKTHQTLGLGLGLGLESAYVVF